ncbi:MAG: fibronectin type III domain-containing protein, partial [Armatimonadota bacterium]
VNQVGSVRQPPCPDTPDAYGYCAYSYAYRNTALMQSLNPQNVSRPAMPWKTSPSAGHIKGTVTRGGAGWLDGTTVTASGPVNRSTSTDGTGFYAFIDLPPGSYTVTAYKPGYGYRTADSNPVVIAGQVTTCNIDYPESLTISNVQAGSENGSQFTVTWTTNLPSTSQVAWGLDNSCPNLTTEDTNPVTNHSVTLTGLQPLTPYYFKVISRVISPPALAESPVYAWATGATQHVYIIDNPEATFVGSWLTGSTAADKYGADYRYTSGASPGKSATWTPNIERAGNYKVYVWYPAGSNRYTASPYTVYYNGGSQLYAVNQTTGGGQWNLLGTHSFAVGTTGYITLTNNGVPSDKNVMADAVRFEEVLETTPPSVPTNLQASALSDSRIQLTWNASMDNVAVAGYRVYRGGACIAICTTTSYTDTGLSQNTAYTYSVSAFDTSGNKSANSPSVTRYTLCKAPTPETVTCNKAAGVWHTSNPFAFTAVGGFGPGKVFYYQVAWDTSPSHVWTGSETTWMFGTISFDAVTGPDPYYLHIRGYNQEGVPCQPSDFGPYYLDATAPTTPIVIDDGDFTASGIEIHASWSSFDPDSGIEEFQYAVGTTPGGNEIVDWTLTSETSEV